MKKVFAVVLAVVLVMCLSVTAFAAVQSPTGVSVYTVYVINGNGAKTQITEVKVGDSITLTADPEMGKFDKWMIYKMDGTPAVEGEDYIIVEGSLTSKTITIIPLSNIIITGNYNGKITKFDISNGEPVSPQTGDTSVVMLSAMMVLALAGVVVAKKQLAK